MHGGRRRHESFLSRVAGPQQVGFERAELPRILDLYGRMVAAGEWRDYAMDFTKDYAVFAAFRRTAEVPQMRVEKRPALRQRQGMWALFGEAGPGAQARARTGRRAGADRAAAGEGWSRARRTLSVRATGSLAAVMLQRHTAATTESAEPSGPQRSCSGPCSSLHASNSETRVMDELPAIQAAHHVTSRRWRRRGELVACAVLAFHNSRIAWNGLNEVRDRHEEPSDGPAGRVVEATCLGVRKSACARQIHLATRASTELTKATRSSR